MGIVGKSALCTGFLGIQLKILLHNVMTADRGNSGWYLVCDLGLLEPLVMLTIALLKNA